MNDNNQPNNICISCDGTGKLECSCISDDKNCIICKGEREFECPICDGTGIF